MQALEFGFFALPVSNMETAQFFYGKVMGWEFNNRDSAFSYILANGNMVGSLNLASENFKPSGSGPLLYFRAVFLEKTLTRVVECGGTVLEVNEMEGGNKGYTGKIQDPSGNALGFWAPLK